MLYSTCAMRSGPLSCRSQVKSDFTFEFEGALVPLASPLGELLTQLDKLSREGTLLPIKQALASPIECDYRATRALTTRCFRRAPLVHAPLSYFLNAIIEHGLRLEDSNLHVFVLLYL